MTLKIKSSLRESRRYIIISSSSQEQIEKIILDYIGILGWAKAAPEFITSGKNIILAVNAKEITNIRGAFALSADKIKILGVSGTLKGLKKFDK